MSCSLLVPNPAFDGPAIAGQDDDGTTMGSSTEMDLPMGYTTDRDIGIGGTTGTERGTETGTGMETGEEIPWTVVPGEILELPCTPLSESLAFPEHCEVIDEAFSFTLINECGEDSTSFKYTVLNEDCRLRSQIGFGSGTNITPQIFPRGAIVVQTSDGQVWFKANADEPFPAGIHFHD